MDINIFQQIFFQHPSILADLVKCDRNFTYVRASFTVNLLSPYLLPCTIYPTLGGLSVYRILTWSLCYYLLWSVCILEHWQKELNLRKYILIKYPVYQISLVHRLEVIALSTRLFPTVSGLSVCGFFSRTCTKTMRFRTLAELVDVL